MIEVLSVLIAAVVAVVSYIALMEYRYRDIH